MKKVILLAIALVLILSSCSSESASVNNTSAPTTETLPVYPEYQISFRGIPWLITEKVYESFIEAENLRNIKNKSVSHQDNEILIYDAEQEKYLHVRGYEKSITHDNSQRYGYLCEVAGYNVSSITATFLPPVKHENGRIKYGNENEAVLYFVEYNFTYGNDNLPSAEKDLIAKLTGLYGDPTHEYTYKDNLGYASERHYTCWSAVDSTRVTLELYHNNLSGYRLLIEYGFYDMDTIDENEWLLNAIKEQEATKNVNNTDGL